MPELPDVEVLRRYFESTALHQKIESVSVAADIVLKDTSPQWLGRKLGGKAFTGTRRHGKFLFARLNEGGEWLLLHFGMTGDLEYYRQPGEEPAYTQVGIHFENGGHLAYVMPRKLGEVRLISDPPAFIEARQLGPDAWGDDFTFEKFQSLLEGRRGRVKPTLTNQKIMAGIGNVYADEILFQAGIHPETKVNQLSQNELREIYGQIGRVFEMAIEHQAKPATYPDSYLTPLRGQEGAECPGCGGELARIVVSGRGTYLCPACQEKPTC